LSALYLFALVMTSGVFAQPNGQQQGGGGKPSYATYDVIGNNFSSIGVDLDATHTADNLAGDLKALSDGQDLTWGDADKYDPKEPGTILRYLVAKYVSTSGTNLAQTECAGKVDVHQAYIFHITKWTNRGVPTASSTLLSSAWYVYRRPRHPRWEKNPTKKNDLVKADLTGTGDPLIYGASEALIVGIDLFDPQPAKDAGGKEILDNVGKPTWVPAPGTLVTTYSVTVTQGTPENLTDLGALASALGGVSGTKQQALASGGKVPLSTYVAVACQQGTKKLPFDVSITSAVGKTAESAKDGSTADAKADLNQNLSITSAAGKKADSNVTASPSQAPKPGTAICSGNGNTPPCSTNRTFTSLDHEYWDVSIGVSIPGVRQTGYTFSNGTVNSSVTRHTDLYAFADVFPFGTLVPKQSWVPHINAGVPVTSQSFYRPYFGMAENLTGWKHLQKALSLPVSVNFFAGAVYMKTQYIVGNPQTSAEFNSDLHWRRVWKPMFGIEVPVSAMASKLGGKSSSKNASGTGKGGS
jgi:hypothetical protein